VSLRPPEHTVGFGVPYADPDLAVRCGTCKAPIGAPCTRPNGLLKPGRSHTTRQGVAHNGVFHQTAPLASRLENAAIRELGDRAPYFGTESHGHPCGIAGPHLLSDCTALVGSSPPLATSRRPH
jgi:hypothetical protein